MITMKTNTKTQIVLKDGKSTIGTWTIDFAQHPTVGDRIEVPQEVLDALPGYGAEAVISMVRLDPHSGELNIEAAAKCSLPIDQRPVVILNSDLVPERVRAQVEKHLRNRLKLPLLDWEESSVTDPIVQLHPFNSQQETPLPTLQKELHAILLESSELAHC